MPISFIFSIIFALIALALFAVHRVSKREIADHDAKIADLRANGGDTNPGYGLTAVQRLEEEREKLFVFPALISAAVFGLAGIFFLFAIIAAVPAKSIGVVTSFGKPVDQMDSGLNFKAPWHKVTRLDGTIQTNSAIGSKGEGPESEDYDIGDVTVRLGNESLATVRYTVRWRIKLDTAQALYSEYRGMGKIRESLVTRETFDALNKVLGQYDPLAEIKGNTNAGTQSFNDYAQEIKRLIQNSEDGSRIEVISVSLPLVQYDSGTQKKLDAYQTQVAATRVAEELFKTNTAQAEANKALSKSISNDPNVLVKQCFDMLDNLADKGKTAPAGFSCWPGSNVDGLIVK